MILRRRDRSRASVLLGGFFFGVTGIPGLFGVHVCSYPGHGAYTGEAEHESHASMTGSVPSGLPGTTSHAPAEMPDAPRAPAMIEMPGVPATVHLAGSADATEPDPADCGCGCRLLCLIAPPVAGAQTAAPRLTSIELPQTVVTTAPAEDRRAVENALVPYFLPPSIAPPSA